MVKALVAGGANPNAKTFEGATPLVSLMAALQYSACPWAGFRIGCGKQVPMTAASRDSASLALGSFCSFFPLVSV